MAYVTPYSVNAETAAREFRAGRSTVLVIGDSQWGIVNTGRLHAGLVRRCPVAWRGGVCPSQVASASDAYGEWTQSGDGSTCTLLDAYRPGEVIPNGIGRGLNMRVASYYRFSGNFPAFGTLSDAYLKPGNFLADPFTNRNMAAGMTAIATPSGNVTPFLGIYNRAGTRDDPGRTSVMTFAGSVQLISRLTAPFAMGTGSAFTNRLRIEVQALMEIEGITILDWFPLQFYAIDAAGPGNFVNYAGHGGFTTLAHASAAGETLTIDGRTFAAGYSDAAFDFDIATFGYTDVWIMLGHNIASGETGGTNNLGSFGTNIAAVISRVQARFAAASRPVRITLISPWDRVGDSGRAGFQEEVLSSLVGGSVGIWKLRSAINGTYGSVSSWGPTYLADGTHPNTAGVNAITDVLWNSVIMPATSTSANRVASVTAPPRWLSK